MIGVFSWFRRRPHERAGFLLYGRAVAAARQPVLFADLGIPDTRPGRFEAVCLFVALLIRRCRRDADPRGAALAQAVFDAMFADMDHTLRELGVGDLSVGKKNRELWEAFHGRAAAYEAALDAGDDAALAAALARNVWRDAAPAGAAERLAAIAQRAADSLAAQPFEALAAGQVRFAEAAA
ncbi:MAG: ubiquinol-cytochrome C chaperone family protein [Elioraea tepidiphila]